MNTFYMLLFSAYFLVGGMLFLYGLHAYAMIVLFRRRQQYYEADARALRDLDLDRVMQRPDLPHVTTQLPLYNEYNVCERAIRAIAAMRYPAGKHEIQILDDSNDDTSALVDLVAAELMQQGLDIAVLRRDQRVGFKAGALDHGLRQAKGQVIAIFDADFVPGPDFLLQTMETFLERPDMGLVQTRWGHLNAQASLLTRAQRIGIDGHFVIEQCARTWNKMFMNFNGTAGLWRRSAIDDAGGWQWDTITEDLDLSYRMQLQGWQTVYRPAVIVPAELPESVLAFKNQQFRWAKGSMQTAKKLMPRIFRSHNPLVKKILAFFHITHYAVHPLMLCQALLTLPILFAPDINPGPVVFTLLGVFMAFAMLAPSSLYIYSLSVTHVRQPRVLLWIPALVMVGVGLAVSNTRAVVEALIGVKSPFKRTPKRGDRNEKAYRLRLPTMALFELAAGIYVLFALHYYLLYQGWLVGPFLAVYAAGFLFMGLLTICHGFGRGLSR